MKNNKKPNEKVRSVLFIVVFLVVPEVVVCLRRCGLPPERQPNE